MFKVKATMVGAMGDESKYPCHFNYKAGDEIIWTGAEMKGRICPAVLTVLSQKMSDMYAAGPRYVDPYFYVPFWYAPPSTYDPSLKDCDGIGFKPILKTIEEPKDSMCNLRPPNSFTWPPHPKRDVNRQISFVCPDARTSLVFMLEAYDLAEDGDSVTYFRRQMSILAKGLKNPGINVDKILDEYSKEQIENIYPPLSQVMIECLVEELELLDFVKIDNGAMTVTPKGAKKVEVFRNKLTESELKVLEALL